MEEFVGGCAIAGAKFGTLAELQTLSGARAEAHRYWSLCRDLLTQSTATNAVQIIDSKPRAVVYARFGAWAESLRKGAAIVFIATHAFQGRRGLVFQCEDSIAGHREYTGVKLFDLYEMVANSPAHFYFVIECCRTKIYSDDVQLDDFHPRNVTIIYSCEYGQETLDWTDGAGALLREAICGAITPEASLSFEAVLDDVRVRAERKKRTVQIVGRAGAGTVNIGQVDAEKHRNERKLMAIELRTLAIPVDKLQSFEGVLSANGAKPTGGGEAPLHYDAIDQSDRYRIWTSETFDASFYDIVTACVSSVASFESIALHFAPGAATRTATAQLRRLGFMQLGEHKNVLHSTGRHVQQRAQIDDNAIIFNFTDAFANPIAIEFNSSGLFEFIASQE